MIEVKGVTIDKKWKLMAMDKNGRVYEYKDMPLNKEQVWRLGLELEAITSLYLVELNSIPWDQSLHEIQHTDDGLILMPWRPSFIVDDPVMVRNCENNKWERRHFARWGAHGELLAWQHGATSFTSSHGLTVEWSYYRLPTPEELNCNANHK